MRKISDPARSFRLRTMTPSDMVAVLELERRSFTHPWSPELIRKELSHEWSTILIAEEPRAFGRPSLLGVLIFWLVHDEIHILNVATEPKHRRRGVATLLLTEALERGRQQRCTLATLEVRRGNEGAQKLYRAFGFRAVGIRPNYYVEEGEDAVVMVLDL